MKKTKENQIDMDIMISRSSALDLRGRQSVRATFRLSEDCIDAISILSAQLGIKQKSVFDHLMEDAKVLKDMARELENIEIDPHKRIQKTFVISRKSLNSLDETSRSFNAPRDALVEYSIQRLLPVIAKERERHSKRKAILNDINAHLAQGLKILQKAQSLLGEDDPVYVRFETAMQSLVNSQVHIENYVKKGSVIEDF